MILRSAFFEHVLLIFRGMELDDLELKTSADWLGSIGKIHMPLGRRRDEDLNIQLVSNIRNEFNEEIGSFGDSDMWFHHDNSFHKRLIKLPGYIRLNYQKLVEIRFLIIVIYLGRLCPTS